MTPPARTVISTLLLAGCAAVAPHGSSVVESGGPIDSADVRDVRESRSAKPPHAAGDTACREPRPEICTMDYRPVCATLRHGAAKTYPNSCGACADPEVISWREGECPT